jgi:hypothetical protein
MHAIESLSAPDLNPRFLLVVDEARELLGQRTESEVNRFRIFRRALRNLGDDADLRLSLRLFAVLADTSSRISNFLASSRQGFPSTRLTDADNNRLHDLFYLVSNMDVLYNDNLALGLAAAMEKKNLFTLGRPLWAATFKGSLSLAGSLADLARLAERKILGGSSANHLKSVAVQGPAFNAIQKIAILNMRVPLNLCAVGLFSDALPANHMRNIASISKDRELVFSAYAAEPVLAYTAGKLMFEEPELSPFELLVELKRTMLLNMIDRGCIGEQLVAFL